MPEIISRKEAKALGLTRYFTGQPCKHGHICERLTLCTHCRQCKIIRGRKRLHKPRPGRYRRKARTPKKCIMCGTYFAAKNPIYTVCGLSCRIARDKELHRKYHNSQAGRDAAKNRVFSQEEKEYRRKKCREWHYKNRELEKQKSREWYAKNMTAERREKSIKNSKIWYKKQRSAYRLLRSIGFEL